MKNDNELNASNSPSDAQKSMAASVYSGAMNQAQEVSPPRPWIEPSNSLSFEIWQLISADAAQEVRNCNMMKTIQATPT
eukprot:CAMPEP_0115317950 /NCGR_PEP_ID=MMETSP0270-20121206/78939_1 /TAXON_ID=71861 /ORGANISM="Scrippsiella trochoidea, Strain CCMP3099" /LENGTH=78 /DNA_ID=CAMNT_0002737477 /DNA_START=82 /DNA_END=314 /DNA_ORIENTATION=+